MIVSESATLLDGLGFPEGLRWHEGELWLSDMCTRKVLSVTPAGQWRQRAYVPFQPSGLGWAPDDTLLVSSMLDQRVVAIRDDGREVVADLTDLAVGATNDMLVDHLGRAYVGSHGFDPAYAWRGGDFAGQVQPAPLALVDASGAVSVAAADLMCANGMALTADRSRMIVAESAAHRITVFDVGQDGHLSGRRTFADLDSMPDGLCIDSEDAIWVALLGAERFARIAEGGEVLDEIPTPGRIAVDCVLGGPDGRTLFGAVAYSPVNVWSDGQVSSGIETWRVDVPAREATVAGREREEA